MSSELAVHGNRVRDRKWIAWTVALLVVAAVVVHLAWFLQPRQERVVSQLDILRNDELTVSFKCWTAAMPPITSPWRWQRWD